MTDDIKGTCYSIDSGKICVSLYRLFFQGGCIGCGTEDDRTL